MEVQVSIQSIMDTKCKNRTEIYWEDTWDIVPDEFDSKTVHG